MAKKIAIIYSTVDGQTLKICKKLENQLLQNNLHVQLFSVDEFKDDILTFVTLIIGASIRYGVHNEKIINFINTNKQQLETVKTAFKL